MTHATGDVVTAGHQHQSKAQFYWVWIGLLVITVVEILLAYNQVFLPARMLAVLLVLLLQPAATRDATASPSTIFMRGEIRAQVVIIGNASPEFGP